MDRADGAVGALAIAEAGELEFLRQPILQRAKHPLASPTRLRRIGGNVLDSKPVERAPDLGEPVLVDPLAGLGREEIGASAIAIEAPPQTPSPAHLHPPPPPPPPPP